jgi:DNA-binding beta-propeller fold protein YncE
VVFYSTRVDNRIHALDAATLTHLASIDAGVGAHELAVDPSGRYLVGTAYGGPGAGHQPADNRVVVIDIATQKVLRTVSLRMPDAKPMQRPNDLVFLPRKARAEGKGSELKKQEPTKQEPAKQDGKQEPAKHEAIEVLLTVESPPHLVKLDILSGDIQRLALGDAYGHMLAMSPSGSEAYVAHVLPGLVSVVDVASLFGADAKAVNGPAAPTHRVEVPTGAEGIACSPRGDVVWVASNRSDVISIVSPKEGKVVRSVACAGFPFRVRFSPDAKHVAVSLPNADAIAVFDAGDEAKVDRIDVTMHEGKAIAARVVPTSIAWSSDSQTVYAVVGGPAEGVVAVDVKSKSVRSVARARGLAADALAVAKVAWQEKNADDAE